MKGRKHRNTGGVNDAADDLKTKPEARTNAREIDSEAEKRKRGGRAERKRGGDVKHVEAEGEESRKRGDRKPRKSGGSCDEGNVFSSARHGTPPKGRKVDGEME